MRSLTAILACCIFVFLTSTASGQSGQAYRHVYSFRGGEDGSFPNGALVQGPDQKLYGVLRDGGQGFGTLYSLTTGGQFDRLHSFSVSDGTRQSVNNGGLVVGLDGMLY